MAVNLELKLLEIWCIKLQYDREFFDKLTNNCNISSLLQLQQLNRYEIKQLCQNLTLDTNFNKPSTEDEFLKALDNLDKESPRYIHDDSDGDIDDDDDDIAGGFFESEMVQHRFSALMVDDVKQSITMMNFDSDDMDDISDNTIGFKVGGSMDINLFRDRIKNKKMPKQTDISYVGMFNDYYFDTKTKQKGDNITDNASDDQKNDITTVTTPIDGDNNDINDNDQKQDINEGKKDLFYPSYCYAKARVPYALLAAKSITDTIPDTVTVTKQKVVKKKKNISKKPKTKKRISTNNPSSKKKKNNKKTTKTAGKTSKSKNNKTPKTPGKRKIKAKTIVKKKTPIKKPVTSTTTVPATVGNNDNSMIEDDPDDIVFNVSDQDISERSIFMTVGLNSNIKEKDFKRKKLNLIILLDISGSMNKPFNNNLNSISKMNIAKQSILSLITHLNYDDRFGLVLFNKSVLNFNGSNLIKICDQRMSYFRNIHNISASGGTNFSIGYQKCIEVYKHLYANNQINQPIDAEYDNRIIMITDLNPNMNKKDPKQLIQLVTKYSLSKDMRVYTTFIGVGLDFNSELVSKISKIRGTNYCSVHSNDDFIRKMDLEFDYMVTPLVYDLKLRLMSEGDTAYISDVYGTNKKRSLSLKNGEIISINTLFPSPPNKKGEKKGGIILLKIKQKSAGSDAKKSFNMIVEVSYQDKYDKKYINKQIVEFGDDNKYNSDDYYDNNGVQKGILLCNMIQLLTYWIKHDRYYFIDKNIKKNKQKNKKIKQLYVSNKYKKIFYSFKQYFEKQAFLIKDKSLKKEMDILDTLLSDQ